MNNGVLPQRPEFEVTVSTDEGVRVVAVSGELDLDTMGELNEALAADDGPGATTVVDLRGLTFIDSSGVSGVLAAARRARDVGARLVCVPRPGPDPARLRADRRRHRARMGRRPRRSRLSGNRRPPRGVSAGCQRCAGSPR